MTPPYSCVLDAFALLAVLNNEPGAEAVSPLLTGALVSSVNWSETVQKAAARGVDTSGLRQEMEALGLIIVPFGAPDAEDVAHL